MNKLFKLNRKGFTLIELIVVVAILGILVSIAVPKYLDYTKDAQIATMQADAKVLSNAALQYHIKNGDWPVEYEKDDEGEPKEPKEAVPGAFEFDINDFTAEMKAILGLEDKELNSVEVFKLDEAALNNYIKNLSGKYEDYVIVTEGDFEGEVFHVEGIANGNKYFNGIYETPVKAPAPEEGD